MMIVLDFREKNCLGLINVVFCGTKDSQNAATIANLVQKQTFVTMEVKNSAKSYLLVTTKFN
jgi:hypothetical protein